MGVGLGGTFVDNVYSGDIVGLFVCFLDFKIELFIVVRVFINFYLIFFIYGYWGYINIF